MRLTRPQMFMEIAHVVARRSTCNRLNVGAIVVHKNRIISMGYNGQPPFHPHCHQICEEGKCNTIHAEENAIKYLPSGEWDDLDLYVTDSPCGNCAQLILDTPGINRVFFQSPYRIMAPVELLLAGGLQVYRVFPNGAVIDQEHNKLVTDVIR